MSFISAVPETGSVVGTGQVFTIVTTFDGNELPTLAYNPAVGPTEQIFALTSGGSPAFQAGYSGSFVFNGSFTEITFTFRRDAGWGGNGSFIIVVSDNSGTFTLNYTLLAEGQYPPDMQPFNDPAPGGDNVGGTVQVEDDGVLQGTADTLNFAANLTASVAGGVAQIDGQGGGGSAGSVSGAIGLWKKGNTVADPTAELTGFGTFDVDNTLPFLTTVMRMHTKSPFEGEDVYQMMGDLPAGYLMFQDQADPGVVSTVFEVLSVTADQGGLWTDFTLAWVSGDGSAWSLNPYILVFTPKKDATLDTYLALADTPNDPPGYAGQALRFLQVNSGETGQQFSVTGDNSWVVQMGAWVVKDFADIAGPVDGQMTLHPQAVTWSTKNLLKISVFDSSIVEKVPFFSKLVVGDTLQIDNEGSNISGAVYDIISVTDLGPTYEFGLTWVRNLGQSDIAFNVKTSVTLNRPAPAVAALAANASTPFAIYQHQTGVPTSGGVSIDTTVIANIATIRPHNDSTPEGTGVRFNMVGVWSNLNVDDLIVLRRIDERGAGSVFKISAITVNANDIDFTVASQSSSGANLIAGENLELWAVPVSGAGGSTDLDSVITAAPIDNDVIIPSANPVVFRDGGNVTTTPLSIEKTGDTTTTPAIDVTTAQPASLGIRIKDATSGTELRVTQTGITHGGDTSDPLTFGGGSTTAAAGTVTVQGIATTTTGKGGAIRVRGGDNNNATSGDGGDVDIEAGFPLISGANGSIQIGLQSPTEIEFGQGFTVGETATPPAASVATKGQYWARSTDGRPIFTDNVGTDLDISADNPGFGEFQLVSTTASSSQDPGSGNWQTNVGDTRIDISNLSQTGLDVSARIADLTSASSIYLRSYGEDRLYNVSAIINRGTYYEVTVTIDNSSTGFALNVGDLYSVNVDSAGGTSAAPEGTDVKSTGVTNGEVLSAVGDGTSIWQPAGAPGAHLFGGTSHTADLLANVNLKISDATLDDASSPRTPLAHQIADAAVHTSDTLANLNALIGDANLDDVSGVRTADAISTNAADVVIDVVPPTVGQVLKATTATAAAWQDEAGGGAVPHLLGGAQHLSDTLANLNAKIGDANLDADTAPRPPLAHQHAAPADLTDATSTGGQVLETDGAGGFALIPTPGGGGGVATVTAQLGIEDVGTASDPILQPTYGIVANTLIHGDDTRLGNARTPTAHAASHDVGAADEILLASLSSGAATSGQQPVADGSGGLTWQTITSTEGIGEWSFAGTGTGIATAAGTYRPDVASYAAALGFRFNDLNSDTSNKGAFFSTMVVGDKLYIQNVTDKSAYGVYVLTELPSDLGTEALFANLSVQEGTGTMSGPASVAIIWAGGGGAGGGGGQVNTVVGGTSITVDATDAVNPIVNLDPHQHLEADITDLLHEVDVQDGGVLQGSADVFDYVGTGVTATVVGKVATITVAGGAAPVDSVFSRTGTVVAVAGDYSAAEVTNAPAGNILAATVQAAINELDTEKSGRFHTHIAPDDITDATSTGGQVLETDGAGGFALIPTPTGGGSISVTDGTTFVDPATQIDFTSGAVVTDSGGGIASVAISGGGGVHAASHETGGADLVDHDLLTNATADKHRIILEGTAANKPAANVSTGSYYHSTDTGTYERSDGANWLDVGIQVDNVTLEATTDLHVLTGGISPAHLAPGGTTPDGTKAYYGDGTWQVPAGGGGGAGNNIGLGQWSYGLAGIQPPAAKFTSDSLTPTDPSTWTELYFNAQPAVGVANSSDILKDIGVGDVIYLQRSLTPGVDSAIFVVTSIIPPVGAAYGYNITHVDTAGSTTWTENDEYTLMVSSGPTLLKPIVSDQITSKDITSITYENTNIFITDVPYGNYQWTWGASVSHDTVGATMDFAGHTVATDYATGTIVQASERRLTTKITDITADATPVAVAGGVDIISISGEATFDAINPHFAVRGKTSTGIATILANSTLTMVKKA